MKTLTSIAALIALGVCLPAFSQSTTTTAPATNTETLDPVAPGGRGLTGEAAAEVDRVPSGGRGLEGQGSGNTGSGTAVDINTASKAMLKSDLGLTEAQAKAVISHREKNGPLTSADQLESVSGLDAKVAARIKNRVSFNIEASGATATP